jgi:hypothetical protein
MSGTAGASARVCRRPATPHAAAAAGPPAAQGTPAAMQRWIWPPRAGSSGRTPPIWPPKFPGGRRGRLPGGIRHRGAPWGGCCAGPRSAPQGIELAHVIGTTAACMHLRLCRPAAHPPTPGPCSLSTRLPMDGNRAMTRRARQRQRWRESSTPHKTRQALSPADGAAPLAGERGRIRKTARAAAAKSSGGRVMLPSRRNNLTS